MADIDAIKHAHGIVEVLHRLGHLPPARWNGTSPFTISCPVPGHDDHTPSCRIHPDTGRFHCFGCGAHGDIFDLAHHAAGLRSFTEALAWITHDRPAIPATRSDMHSSVRPAATPTFTTRAARILEVNACAWDFLTDQSRTRLADRYLESRGLNLAALRNRISRPVAGHTPPDPAGLSRHLLTQGFGGQEIVEAGWSLTSGAGLRDRFRHRVLFPIRDLEANIVGVIGRDVTDTAAAKYLNSPTTPLYRKGDHLYIPANPNQTTTRLVVCEGPLDALALTASETVPNAVAVAVCGTAMTETQAQLIAAHQLPVIVMADGDAAGRTANSRWQARLTRTQARIEVHTLNSGEDPASVRFSAGSPDF